MASSTDLGDDTRAKLMQRASELAAKDPQFAAAFPAREVVDAKMKPGLCLAEVVKAVMQGYADRPALGQRARELVKDPLTGRNSLELQPRFETISYGELWQQSVAMANEWHRNEQHPLQAGDFVCTLGFTSPDYQQVIMSSIFLGAVYVPLQTSAPRQNHVDIIAETEPRILAASIDYLDAAVDAILAGTVPDRLIVMEYDGRDDTQREQLDAACQRLAEQKCPTLVDTLDSLVERGMHLPEAPMFKPAEGEDPMSALFYTSGSTGTPKGAIFTQSLSKSTWQADFPMPAITLSFMPMAHLVGSGYMTLSLGNGGTSYCSPKADLSTLFEDFALARPTMASLVPRVCELFHHRYLSDYDRRIAQGESPEIAEAELKSHMREKILGGRLLSVGCGSASLAPETYAFMESMLDMHVSIGYSSTEIAGGTVLVDWKIQRPPVLDYKLDDVPELGYFSTDKPYPRGELLVKSDRFIHGYYKQPELTAEKFDASGFYRTGDIMAELGPDHLVYLDRRNNVQKLSQGEFVAISNLEALYSHAQDIHQIYIYANSERAFLLAVIVPSEALRAEIDENKAGLDKAKAAIRSSLRAIAEQQKLNAYEIPRDFIVEKEPFSLSNSLLTEVGKHQRPNLKARYEAELENLFAKLAQEQLDELKELRATGTERPVAETLTRALSATLGIAPTEFSLEERFAELGGDSLAALEFSSLLEDIYQLQVPVGDIINPTSNLQQLVEFVETERNATTRRASFASIHGKDCTTVKASDFKLDKFIDQSLLDNASTLPPANAACNSVLLTGATGYLGRFLAIAWLERLAATGGKLTLIIRAADAQQARRRIEASLKSDPELLAHFNTLAADHLEVVAGDLGAPDLGLDKERWQQLAESVDLIVHAGAHVNHRLPYKQLFPANVAGTAELIRLAISTRLKRFNYISTLGVSLLCDNYCAEEDGDIRLIAPKAEISDTYANGYNISKWASEVLLREASDLVKLPVAVFRPGMILAHSHYKGQLNVPDMFTRLLYSLAVTGVAPATFYARDLSAGRPAGRYEGFSADFIADSVTDIGLDISEGFHSFNLANPDTRDTGLDEFVDWMIAAGCNIERIDHYDAWLARFETAMNALPEAQRQQSILALLDPYRKPQASGMGAHLPTARFVAAAKAAGHAIPELAPAMIEKYVADLQYLKLL